MKVVLGILTVALVACFVACSDESGQDAASPSPTPSVSPRSTVAANAAPADFAVGTEFALPGLAQAYREAGFAHAKPVVEYGVWGNIEPEQGRFEWGPLDYLVNEYHAAGYESLQIVLSAESPWAASSNELLTRNSFPKPEYLDDYVSYVTATVERYDGDGVADAPGLSHGVHRWGVEREFSRFWAGSAEDYVRLLRHAYPAIKAADESAQVSLVALLMTDAFDDGPNTTEGTQRLRASVSFRKTIDEIRTVLAACDAYDVVDFHSLADYVEIPATTDWIREELTAAGCVGKTIVVGDALPMSVLITLDATPVHPVNEKTQYGARAALLAAANEDDPQHETSLEWLRAETAEGAVRKVVVSAGAGLGGINIGNQEDWKTGFPHIDSQAVNSLGSSLFLGLRNTTTEDDAPGGELLYGGYFSRARTAQDERPAFAALRLTLEKIDGFTVAERVETTPDAWVYRFETPRGAVWVAWYDDGALNLPGEPERTTDIVIDVGSENVQLTTTPTTGTVPSMTTLEAESGTLTLTVGGAPVFVETQP